MLRSIQITSCESSAPCVQAQLFGCLWKAITPSLRAWRRGLLGRGRHARSQGRGRVLNETTTPLRSDHFPGSDTNASTPYSPCLHTQPAMTAFLAVGGSRLHFMRSVPSSTPPGKYFINVGFTVKSVLSLRVGIRLVFFDISIDTIF